MLPPLLRFARDVSGAVAPLFAVGLVAFVGVGALAWDISRGYALRAELEAAVDAAALAGATQLDGKAGAITRATTAAQGALVQNSNRLGNAYQANTIQGGDTIQFLTNLTDARTGAPDTTGVALTATDSKANYIEITLAPRPMGLVMGAILGLTQFNARAHAVAGFGSALCKVPPMMICNPNEPGSTAFNASDLTGKGIILTPAPSSGPSGTGTGGMYGFLSVNSSNAANVISDALARNPPLSECYGEQVTPRFGNIASADDWFNMRFDIYVNGQPAAKKTDPAYAPAMNTMIGKKTNSGSNACNIANNALATPSNDCSAFTADPNGMPFPVDCGQTTGPGVGQWNVRKYFATNHSGIDPTSYIPQNPDGTTEGWDYYGPHAASGVTSPTRYQVYNWELAMLKGVANGGIATPAGAFSDSQTSTSGTNDYAKPQCNTTGSQATPDRRTISVVVMNCVADNIKPNQAATVRGYADLFILAPAKDHTIYAEFIEATTDTSAVGEETRFYAVRLYE